MKDFFKMPIIEKLNWICIRVILITFLTVSVIPAGTLYASNTTDIGEKLKLSKPGTLVNMTQKFQPTMLKGVSIHPNEPYTFDFLVELGDIHLSEEELKEESTKLINYFLASLTVPEQDMWVNLSPYEKNRIIPDNFGQTEMGRDLLAQDYMLKQLSASLMYPEEELGEQFWKQVKDKAFEQYGTTEIPMKTFNKVWIVPQEARVYEHERGAVVVESHLNVMLEEDYLALEANNGRDDHGLGKVKKEDLNTKNGLSSQIIKELIIPEIEKEVNEGETFANLRQIYSSMILAVWFKRALKESVLGYVYVDQAKTKGIDVKGETDNQAIYDMYVEAFKVGVYNYIKEDYNPKTDKTLPRQYFSGGAAPMTDEALIVEKQAEVDVVDAISDVQTRSVRVRLSRIAQPSTDFAVLVEDQTLQTFLDEMRDPTNNPFTDVSLEAAIAELDGEAEGALGKGGLGFLTGDTWGAYHHLSKFRGMGVMPLYERHYSDGSSVIDWKNQDGIMPVTLKDSQDVLTFDVDFNLSSFPVEVYWINRNGMPVFLIKSPDFFEQLYPGGTKQIQQYGFLARAYVELLKKLEIAPRIVRLSEGQLVFVATAMQNDVKFFDDIEGEDSVFKDSEIVFTTHTPEQAALPKFPNYDVESLDDLGNLIGWGLFENIVSDGRVNAAVELAKMATIVNGVSVEHGDVTKVAVLPEFSDKTTAVQNGNEEATWYSPGLKQYVGEVGLANVNSKKLFDIGTELKENGFQDLLQNSFGVEFKDPSRPLVGLVRRIVEYKEQRLFIPLVRWIVGDPNKEYFHPETNESLGKGLGANLLIGGHALDHVGPDWVRQFKELMEEDDIKGKFLYVEGTGIELRKIAVAASDVWVSVPRATREASGTSDGAAALNGTVNIATATGGPLSYIKHGKNGWLIDVFGDRNLDDVIRGFDEGEKTIITQFKEQGGRQLAQYLRESTSRYYDYVRRGNTAWLDTMKSSFDASHREVSIEVMIRKYGLLFESILDGTGAAGYEEKMRDFNFAPEGIRTDQAMISTKKGGIDLNPENLSMIIEKEGLGVVVPQWEPNGQTDNVIGFKPMIINVSPVLNLPLILGINLQEEDEQLSLISNKSN